LLFLEPFFSFRFPGSSPRFLPSTWLRVTFSPFFTEVFLFQVADMKPLAPSGFFFTSLRPEFLPPCSTFDNTFVFFFGNFFGSHMPPPPLMYCPPILDPTMVACGGVPFFQGLCFERLPFFFYPQSCRSFLLLGLLFFFLHCPWEGFQITPFRLDP